MRKFDAEILVFNGTVITMDTANAVIKKGYVAVNGNQIEAVGTLAEIDSIKGKKRIDAKGGIIMPGLVNVHTHAAMTLLRGLADDLPLMTWLNEHIFPAESKMDDHQVYQGALLACAEMIMSGTTCFCDMYLFTDAVARAASYAGMRAVVGEVLFDFPSPNYGPIERGFEYTQMLIEKWQAHELITIAVEPHSPYLCAPELLQRASNLAQKNELPLIIHLSETRDEVSNLQAKFSATPVQHLANLNVLAPNVIACHCVVLSAEDIRLLDNHHVKVAHNPESNMKLASGIAPIPTLQGNGICVGIGTDGCASNNNLDMLSEIDTAAKLHKVNTLDPTVMDAQTVLKMATIDGARCLGLDHIIGSLEPGKRADIIILDTHKPHLTPMYNPISHIVYAARGSDVSTSIINGQLVMEDRKIGTFDWKEVMQAVARIAATLAPEN